MRLLSLTLLAVPCAAAFAASNTNELIDRGNDLLHKHQYAEAVKVLSKVIAQDPKNATAFDDRACAYVQLKQYRKAIEDENKSITINDGNYLAHLNRGAAYLEVTDFKNAIADSRRAHELKPSEPSALINLGKALYKSGDHKAARSAFSDAKKIYADSGLSKEAKELGTETEKEFGLKLD